MKTTSAIGLVFGLLSVAPALAQTPSPAASATERPLIERLINTPFVQNWNTWGLTSPPTPQPAQGVTGGKALSIDVRRAGDPWSVGAVMTNTGAVKSGDVLLLGVWVRAAALPDDQTRTHVPLLLLEGATEPKPVLARATNVAVGPEWTMIYASGVAEADFAPGQTSIIMQMGQARHRLELGPALLFNFGPDYDRARLPRNPEG